MDDRGEAQQLSVCEVSTPFLATLGIRPFLGRGFSARDRSVVLISYRYWDLTGRRALQEALGATISITDRPHQIVGVMPQGIAYPGGCDVWIHGGSLNEPTLIQQLEPSAGLIGRLSDGYSMQQAQLELTTRQRRFEVAYSLGESAVVVAPLADTIQGSSRRAVAPLLVGTLAILAMTCLNAGELMMTRRLERWAETAVALALGATRGGIAAQALVDALVLALAGGLGGAALASVTLPTLLPLLPPDLPIDTPLLARNVVLAVMASAVFSCIGAVLLPIAAGMTTNPLALLKGAEAGQGQMPSWGLRLGSVLLAAQLALACAVLVTAASALRSVASVIRAPRGFDTQRVYRMDVQASQGNVLLSRAARNGETTAFDQLSSEYATLLEDIRAYPSVESVAATSSLPYSDRAPHLRWVSGSPAAAASGSGLATLAAVSPDYFQVLRMPVVAGRAFNSSDTATSEPIVIVDERSMAGLWGGSAGVGGQLQIDGELRRVVGMVRRVKSPVLASEAYAQLYVPLSQAFSPPGMPPLRLSLLVRFHAHTQASVGAIKLSPSSGLAAAGPFQALDDVVAEVEGYPKHRLLLVTLLGAFALSLTLVATFSVVSHFVARHARNFAIRMAVGATPRASVQSVLRRTALLLGVAGFLGTVAAVQADRGFGARVPNWQGIDTAAALAGFLVVAASALLTTVVASWRTFHREPADILRHSM